MLTADGADCAYIASVTDAMGRLRQELTNVTEVFTKYLYAISDISMKGYYFTPQKSIVRKLYITECPMSARKIAVIGGKTADLLAHNVHFLEAEAN